MLSSSLHKSHFSIFMAALSNEGAPYGHAVAQLSQPMQRSLSMNTIPSFLLPMAPTGQIFLQAGSAQWLQLMDRE
jgi:hypothetical protein